MAGRLFQIPPVTTHRPRRFHRLRRVLLIAGATLFALYLVLVIVGGGLSPRFDDSFSTNDDSLLLFAHRGVALNVPENSEAALSEAQRLGFSAIEIDVRKTRDGELVLFHDKTGRSLLGLNEKPDDLTLDEIKGHKLLFANKETTNNVPTLREVFQKFGKTLRFYLDMKNKKFEDADRIVALIDEFGLYDRTILASVDPLFVAYAEHKYPKVNTALERFDFFQVWLYRLIPRKWKPDYLSGLARKVTAAHVDWLRKERLLPKRIAYEADGPEYDRVLKLGITKVLVDFEPTVHSGVLTQSISSGRDANGLKHHQNP